MQISLCVTNSLVTKHKDSTLLQLLQLPLPASKCTTAYRKLDSAP